MQDGCATESMSPSVNGDGGAAGEMAARRNTHGSDLVARITALSRIVCGIAGQQAILCLFAVLRHAFWRKEHFDVGSRMWIRPWRRGCSQSHATRYRLLFLAAADADADASIYGFASSRSALRLSTCFTQRCAPRILPDTCILDAFSTKDALHQSPWPTQTPFPSPT